MASRVPHLLEPYLLLPAESSLILLTNILSASTNWLVLRYLHSFLAKANNAEDESGREGTACVVLVSYLRDWAFWKEGARKLGLDLEKLGNKKRFVFVDGLTSLFLPTMSSKTPSTSTPSSANPRPADIAQIREDIKSSIRALQDTGEQNKPVLIIDGLDLVLATFATADPVSLSSMVLDLCENVHTTILCLASDGPFVHQQRTPLEINQASFLLNMAHMADLLISLRGLGTGCARDVSGVLRISRMRCTSIRINEGGKEKDGRELLYHVSGDGVVKVFERGE